MLGTRVRITFCMIHSMYLMDKIIQLPCSSNLPHTGGWVQWKWEHRATAWDQGVPRLASSSQRTTHTSSASQERGPAARCYAHHMELDNIVHNSLYLSYLVVSKIKYGRYISQFHYTPKHLVQDGKPGKCGHMLDKNQVKRFDKILQMKDAKKSLGKEDIYIIIYTATSYKTRRLKIKSSPWWTTWKVS